MKTPVLIDLLDLYGRDIPLQIFSSPKKKSFFGAIMGFLSIVAMGVIIFYFLFTLFSRDTKQIITNQNFSLTAANDLSNSPIYISFLDPLGNFVPNNAGIWNVYSYKMETLYYTNGTFEKNTFTPLQLRPCTTDDLQVFQFKNPTFLANGMCIPYGKYNLTLNGNLKTTGKTFSQLLFFLTKCNQKLNSNCKNTTVINAMFDGGVLGLQTSIGVIDHDNNTQPYVNTFQLISVNTRLSLFKQTSVLLTQNLYTDDLGFVFESLVTYDFYTLGEIKTDYSLAAPASYAPLTGGSEVVSFLAIQNSQPVTTTKRTFLKAQAILANIGGIVKFIMVIAQIITHIVTRKSVFIHIGNEVFDYFAKKQNNLKETKVGNNNNFLEIEGKTEKVVPISDASMKKENMSPSLEIKRFNLRAIYRKNNPQLGKSVYRPPLKLSLYDFLCISGCVRDRKMMSKYEATEKMILEKVSVHSIIRDSYKLNTLSKLTLNAEEYRRLKRNTHVPIEVTYNNIYY